MVNNVFAVVDKLTGQQIMRVIDAADQTDPAFNPEGSVRIEIDPTNYSIMIFAQVDAAVIATGAAQGIMVKSAIPAAPSPTSEQIAAAAKVGIII